MARLESELAETVLESSDMGNKGVNESKIKGSGGDKKGSIKGKKERKKKVRAAP